ncbi:hypothetical protein FI667_g6209, partial [Globisporangium splendens]
MRADERNIRPDSLTNRLRVLAKQKPRKRHLPILETVPQEVHVLAAGHDGRGATRATRGFTSARPHGAICDASVYRCSNGSASSEWLDAADGAIAVAGQHQRFMVERLQRGCGFEFRVSARNLLGESPFAYLDEIVWTYRFLPPTAPKCVAKTSFSLHLEWRDGHDTDGDEHDDLVYEVQLCQVECSATTTAAMRDDDSNEDHDGDNDGATQLQHDADLDSLQWRVAAQNLRDHRVIVSGLSPLSCYVFRIRASSPGSPAAATNASESVFSPVSSTFQTGRRI